MSISSRRVDRTNIQKCDFCFVSDKVFKYQTSGDTIILDGTWDEAGFYKVNLFSIRHIL
jgi:hypothetical protein